MYKLNKFIILTLIILLSISILSTAAYAAPEGGEVTAGEAEIKQQDKTTDINQSSNKAAINWQKFGIKADETVNFNQISKDAITLNRIIGNEKSIIDGALNADGQVWILNSSGVLFGENARVNTAGLLATTKKLSDQDFMDGNYNFSGDSQKAVINRGKINISDAGYAALFGKEAVNEGVIRAELGEIHLKGGKKFSLNLNGNSMINLTVTEGELDALVENKKAVIADGGEIYLTTNAADELLKGVVNNEGIAEAKTVADVLGGDTAEESESKEGRIEVFAHGGTANVGGKLTTGEGEGFIETSGRYFNISEDAEIISGHWLIDPTNITITDATSYENSLNDGTDIEVQTDATGSEEGNIYVEDTIIWDQASKLTLNAHNNIIINESIKAENADGQLALYYGQGTNDGVINETEAVYEVNDSINLKAGKNFFTRLGYGGNKKTYQVITSLGDQKSKTGTDLSGIKGNKDGNYVLGKNIDAGATSDWSSVNYEGFIPLGIDEKGHFTGIFDGLGHTIKGLHIANDYDIGLFGEVTGATIKNIGLNNVSMKNLGSRVGGLIGTSHNSTIINSYIEGSSITGENIVGGLIGKTDSGTIIRNSYSSVDVKGDQNHIGGLVGENVGNGVIKDSHATGNITGTGKNSSYIGGLVGELSGSIENSYATGDVIGVEQAGGLVGTVRSGASIIDSYATGNVTGDKYIGGLTGRVDDNNYTSIENSFYNIDQVMINGEKKVTAYGIYENQFNDWKDDKQLSVDNYFNTADDGAYLISGIDDMKNLLGFSLEEGYKFRLKSDIDFANYDFPNKQDYFIPVLLSDFDGNQQQLSNLKIKNTKEERILANRGLFGYTEAVEIKNLNLTGFTIDGLANVGTLVGKAIKTDIKNVHTKKLDVEGISNLYGSGGTGGLVGNSSTSTISGSSTSGLVTGQGQIGGLVGSMNNNIINDSYSNVEVISQKSGKALGGLVGTVISSTIKNSYATNDVSGGAFVGGLIGYTENSKIENSYSKAIINIADLNTKPQYFGGLVGAGGDYTIFNSYASGFVDTLKANYVGGLVGGSNLGTIKNSYATNDVTGNYNVGGLVGYMNAGPRTIENSYSTGTVTGTDKVGGLVGTLRNEAIKNSYTISVVNSDGDNFGGLVGYQPDKQANTITASYFDKTINPGMPDESDYGQSTESLQEIALFADNDWSIAEDSSRKVGYPVLGENKDTIWLIGTKKVEDEDSESKDPEIEKEILDGSDIVRDIYITVPVTADTNNISIDPGSTASALYVINDEGADGDNGESGVVYLSELDSEESQEDTASDSPGEDNVPTDDEEDGVEITEDEETDDVNVRVVRVRISNNSLVELVNGGVSLPAGVDQVFYFAE